MKHIRLMIVAATLWIPAAVMACPMCKDSIPNSDAAQSTSLPGGFNISVYSMLIGLFATIGLCATVITRGVRNANSRMQLPDNDESRNQNDQ